MNYYELIKKELINNDVYKKVKDYSKNKSDLKRNYYFNLCLKSNLSISINTILYFFK